ncbi:hypothetical protein B0T13DRAFT_477301 [Neurospora crassa]|nr:hypothetical protein B0T13DRAFT_477301 [Neurospora crassa]
MAWRSLEPGAVAGVSVETWRLSVYSSGVMPGIGPVSSRQLDGRLLAGHAIGSATRQTTGRQGTMV